MLWGAEELNLNLGLVRRPHIPRPVQSRHSGPSCCVSMSQTTGQSLILGAIAVAMHNNLVFKESSGSAIDLTGSIYI